MTKTKQIGALLLVAASLLIAGPVGCQTRLAADGVYKGDKVLYNADKTIRSAYTLVHTFVEWEHQYRSVLPVEVSRAADSVRDNAQGWIRSAIALRDVYEANPTPEGRRSLESSLLVLQKLLDEIALHMAKQNERIAASGTITNAPPALPNSNRR